MIGKILGVALVGLTQFILWVCLTMVISSLAEILFINSPKKYLTVLVLLTNH